MQKKKKMNTYTSLETIPESARGAVVAIGNFDGVHRGHQILLAQAGAMAKGMGRDLGVLTFEPHPSALFRPDEPPSRITPLGLKAEKLQASGTDHVYALNFNWEFASQSAEQFIEKILKKGLNAAHIVVGHDFRFGQLRKGTPDMIERAGIPLTLIQEQKNENAQTYASSTIRQHLRRGEIEQANERLGWDWEIWGTIIKGDGRGHDFGFPTANMDLEGVVHPAYGVYASRSKIRGSGEWMNSVTNIGIRPMFQVREAQAETFIFDFNDRIYGEILQVRPLRRLRGEAKFDTPEALIAQMHRDCQEAKEVLTVLDDPLGGTVRPR
jgi:riboflavin kinase/FMN adenylyltransferase